MKRNRFKKNKNKMRKHYVRMGEGKGKNLFVVRFLLLAGLLVCGALFYVYQHTQLVRTGYRIRKTEKVLMELTKNNRKLEMKISRLKSPKNLEKLIVTYQLNLVKPKESQVVRLPARKPLKQWSSSRKAPLVTVN